MSAATPPVVIVGAGRLARAVVPALVRAGVAPHAVAVRSERSARRMRRVAPGVPCRRTPEVPDGAWVVLAVPDRAIGSAARDLAGRHPSFRGVALHCAGSVAPDALAPLAPRGRRGVLHPLQSLGAAGGAALAGSRAWIDGGTVARRAARRLAALLDLRPLRISRPPDDDARAAYHAGASVAANDLVALLAIAVDALARAGIERDDALDGLAALVRGSLANVEAAGLARGLTGPVARGDAGTLARHLRALDAGGTDDARIHRLLSRRLLDLVGDALDPAERRRVERRLRGGRDEDPDV